MLTKAIMGLAGAAAIAASVALPVQEPGRDEAGRGILATRSVDASRLPAPVVRKGDRLAVAVSHCDRGRPPTGSASLPAARWVTIEQGVGDATSVLIRIPLADLASAALVSRVFADGAGSMDPKIPDQTARR